MVKFYAKLSKAGRAVFDAVYWIIFLLLLMFLNDQLGVMMLNAETGMPEFHLDTTGMLYVSGTAVLFSSVKILLYKGEKTMAFNYQNKKNQPPADPFLADDDDDLDFDEMDFPEDPQEEEAKSARRRRKKRHKAAEDADEQLQLMQGIEATQYLHQNVYAGAADDRRAFMKNSCNTYEIQLSEQIEADGRKYSVPVGFQSFYLHFEFRNAENENDKLKNDVVDSIEFYLVSVGNNEIVMQAQIIYRLYPFTEDEQEKETFAFKLILGYDDRGQINAVKLGYEEERISILNISYLVKQAIRKLLGQKPANNENMAIVNNDLGTKMDFPHTTRKHHLNAIGTKPVRFCNANGNSVNYIMDVQCFKSFCSIDCPVCGKPVEGLGVPGIVLYNSSNTDALETSDKLCEYLTDRKSKMTAGTGIAPRESDLISVVDEVIEASHTAITGDELPQNWTYENYKSNIRIPLGKRDIQGGRLRIKPYDHKQKTEEKELLHLLNQRMRSNPDDESDDELYLLCPASQRARMNIHIHNTMISQLCSRCFNPLPADFYLYDSVVTLYFYGNANAGKTVLILSEKNEIEDTEFNNLFVSYEDDDFDSAARESIVLDYQRKANRLAQGHFPVGTSRSEIIPGLLSPFKYALNGLTKEFLFNYYDMRGADSLLNWNAASNFVYVHTLMDDPSSFRGGSIYQKLFHMLGGNVKDQRRYNVQFFLTKIDEYPAFLYERIRTHNQQYENCADRKDIMEYTYKLLVILEESLREDFSGRAASEVISEPIQSELVQIEGLGALDFSKSYNAVHKEIYAVCRPIVDAVNDPRKKVCEIVLRYLHGLDVIRDNYFMLRRLILKLLTDMKENAARNEHSNYNFALYAVSATGFTAIEATNKANRGEMAQYAPLFVKEANTMLQQSTFDYIRDTQNLQKKLNGLTVENYTSNRDYLFSEGAVCDRIEDLYREEMNPGVLFGKGIADLQRQGSTDAELAIWYLETVCVQNTDNEAAAVIPTVHEKENLKHGLNATGLSIPASPAIYNPDDEDDDGVFRRDWDWEDE